MMKPTPTMPPSDAAARRRAPPVLTYSVEQIAVVGRRILQPGTHRAVQNCRAHGAAAGGQGFRSAGGHFFRTVSVEGPLTVARPGPSRRSGICRSKKLRFMFTT